MFTLQYDNTIVTSGYWKCKPYLIWKSWEDYFYFWLFTCNWVLEWSSSNAIFIHRTLKPTFLPWSICNLKNFLEFSLFETSFIKISLLHRLHGVCILKDSLLKREGRVRVYRRLVRAQHRKPNSVVNATDYCFVAVAVAVVCAL